MAVKRIHEMTWRQFYDFETRSISADNNVSIAEVKRLYRTEAICSRWVDAILSAVHIENVTLSRTVLDSLVEFRGVRALREFRGRYEHAIPKGYVAPTKRETAMYKCLKCHDTGYIYDGSCNAYEPCTAPGCTAYAAAALAEARLEALAPDEVKEMYYHEIIEEGLPK